MRQIKPEHPIRVLRILSRMNVGGPSKHVVNLTGGLDKIGYETRLAVGLPESAEGSMLRIAEEFNIRPEIIPCFDRPISLWRDSVAFGQIVSHIREFRPHIVHTHTTKAGILGRMAAVLCHVPVIFHTFHGHVFSGYFSAKVSRGIVFLERILAGFTDRLITLTPGLKNDIRHHLRIGGGEKIEVIPLGLALEKNLQTARQSSGWRRQLGLDDSAFLAGIVARLVPVKNHKMLLDAVARIAPRFDNLQLAIVGGGELEAQLRSHTARLGLEKRVHFCGVVRDMEAVYSDLDLLVLSSRNEGTPVVIIEALASGCPVAATRVGGIEEVLERGKYGSILGETDESFTADLFVAMQKAGKTTLCDFTRREIAEKYTIDTLIGRVHNLYRKFLKLRGIDV